MRERDEHNSNGEGVAGHPVDLQHCVQEEDEFDSMMPEVTVNKYDEMNEVSVVVLG